MCWPEPSEPPAASVKMPKGASAGVVPGVADHSARYVRTSVARLHP